MALWIGFIVLTAAVIAFLARPFIRPSSPTRQPHSADVAVYRDQLNAIDAERDEGLLAEGEADAARTELARRLLRAAEQESTRQSRAVAPANRPGYKPQAYAAAAFVAIVSAGVYSILGSPNLPNLPHADRIAKSSSGRSMTELVGMVEARLKQNPEDGQGWAVIAPVYMKQERYQDAIQSYANAIRLLGENPDLVAGFAEAVIFANNGTVTPEAQRAYHRLQTLSPYRPEPKFWLAIAKQQDGNLSAAIADLEALLKVSAPDAPWRSVVEAKIGEMRAELASGGGKKEATAPAAAPPPSQSAAAPPSQPAATPAPGPSAADVAAAQQLTPEQQGAFISKMVEGLAAKLDANGKDLDGWKRLARAYKVMGRDGDAANALAKARRAFEGDAAALQSIESFAKDLGIGS